MTNMDIKRNNELRNERRRDEKKPIIIKDR
jgi:hypothetical protein